MTADLSEQDEPGSFESANEPRAAYLRQSAQAALISTVAILVRGSGTGRPSAFKPST
jgi:hypothetical protein